MSAEIQKRKRSEDGGSDAHSQKKRKGFSVGPANLPDGTYRRKTQKIKNDLISRAKVKKAYAKLRHTDAEPAEVEAKYNPYEERDDPTRERTDVPEDTNSAVAHAGGQEMHPDRLARLDESDAEHVVEPAVRVRKRRKQPQQTGANAEIQRKGGRQVKRTVQDIARPARYQEDFAQAEYNKLQNEDKKRIREQRDKERRAMTKARKPGRDGRPKLGRQSNVLLSRVQRLVAQT